MNQGVKRIKTDIVYLNNDHYCPDCGTKLDVVEVSKILDSNSPEAKQYNSLFDGFYIQGNKIGYRMNRYIGNIEYILDEFECPCCNRHIDVKEMKQIEGVFNPGYDDPGSKEYKMRKRKSLITKIACFAGFVVIVFIVIIIRSILNQ